MDEAEKPKDPDGLALGQIDREVEGYRPWNSKFTTKNLVIGQWISFRDGLFSSIFKGYDSFREGNCCNVSALEDFLGSNPTFFGHFRGGLFSLGGLLSKKMEIC